VGVLTELSFNTVSYKTTRGRHLLKLPKHQIIRTVGTHTLVTTAKWVPSPEQ